MDLLVRPAQRTDRLHIMGCIASLQNAARRIDSRLRPGRTMASAYYDQLRRRCARWHGTILVGDLDGVVVGFVAVLTAVPFTELDEPSGTYALVTDLFVSPAARRQGYGRVLLGHAERYARQQGATDFRIGVLATNRPAVGLYRGAGFRPWTAVLRKRLRPG